jgi:biopolymer transport protein ExbB
MRPSSLDRRRSTLRNAAVLALAVLVVSLSIGAGPRGGLERNPYVARTLQQANRAAAWARSWYDRTPPVDRMTWGGLAASALLGLGVLVERLWRVRRGRVIPRAFGERFLRRLGEGQLDRGKGLDYCELNPSPAARVALAAIRRWGRPVTDLERGVALTRQLEVDRLRRHIGTLRRIAALAPLLGLLGTLTAAGRALSALGTAATAPAWGPAVAAALGPLTAGVALAILALVAYDGLAGRVDTFANELDRIGAEVVDAIALATAADPRVTARPRADAPAPPRSPHPIRLPIPEDVVRKLERDRE